MDILQALFIYTLTFLFVIITVYLFKDTNIPLAEKFSGIAKAVVVRVVPQRIRRWYSRIVYNILYTRHAYFQILYVFLLLLGYTTYSLTSYTYVSETFVGHLPFVLLAVNILLFVACSRSNPGVLTQHNVEKYISVFEYDHVWYKEKTKCTTCRLGKPARSKHCGVCDVCVARFDHHCSWVNNCIGQHNHKYFLFFVLSLVITTFVSSLLTFLVFVSIVDKKKLHLSMFVDKQGNQYKADFSTVVSYLVEEYTAMALLMLYLIMLFVALLLFFSFHVWLLLTNRTTNEVCKSRRSVPLPTTAAATTIIATTGKHRRTVPEKRSHKGQKHVSTGDLDTTGVTGWKVFRRINVFGIYHKGIYRNIVEVLCG